MKKQVILAVFVAVISQLSANADVTLVSDSPSSLWTQDAQGVWSSPQVAAGDSSVASFTTNNPCLITYQYKFTSSAPNDSNKGSPQVSVGRAYDSNSRDQYLETLYPNDGWASASHLLSDADGVYDDNAISFTLNNYAEEGVATFCLKNIEVRPVATQIVNGIEWKYAVGGTSATIVSAVNTNGYWRYGYWYSYPIEGDLEVPATFDAGRISVTEMGNNLFGGSRITSLKIPDSVTKVGENVASSCNSLTNVTIGTGLAHIGGNTFCSNPSLLSFTVSGGNANYATFDDALYDKARKTLLLCPGGKGSLQLASSTTEIAQRACADCAELASVQLNSGLKVVGYSAFASCGALTAIDIPSSVDVLCVGAFQDCCALETVTLNEGLKDIVGGGDMWDPGVFMNCCALEAIAIPNSVTNIGINAFSDCDMLSDVSIGSGVATIGFAAFASCDSLMNFAVSAGNATFEAIGGSIFYKATPKYDKSLALYPSGRGDLYFTGDVKVTEIGYGACTRCDNFTEITITNSVRNIGVESFKQCISLCRLVVPDGITNICEEAFQMNLETMYVEIAGTVEKIGDGAFVHNYVPTSDNGPGRLILHEGIREIGEAAFEMCWKMGEIVIPDSVVKLGENAFESCGGATRIVVGDGVTEIPARAFVWCYNAAAIEIGTNVVTIGESAFEGCTAVRTLDIPDSVTSIEASAFGGCDGLATLTFSENLEYIGTDAFSNCSSLTTLVVPESVETIEEGAFASCNGLLAVYLPKKFEQTLDVAGVFGDGFDDSIINWYETLEYFTVTFNANYQGGATTTTRTLKYVEEYPIPAPRNGYAFAGWWTDPADEETAVQLVAGDEIAADTTYYAHWVGTPFVFGGDAPWCAVGYDSDYEATILQSAPLGYGEVATATTNMSGTGCIAIRYQNNGVYDDWEGLFDYLRVYVDGTRIASLRETSGDWKFINIPVYEPGDHVVTFSYENGSGNPDSHALMSFVEWRPYEVCTLTFNPNYQGGGAATTCNVFQGYAVGDLPTLSRSGYALVGWFTAAEGGSQVTESTVASGDMTLYARWMEVRPFDATGGDADWDYDEDGSWRSGKINSNESTWAQVTVTGPCRVSFDWKTSSESSCDKLHLYVDGSSSDYRTPISGVMSSWDSVSFVFSDSNEHVVKWVYDKDYSTSSGQDCGWVKNLAITPIETCTVTFNPNYSGGTNATRSVVSGDAVGELPKVRRAGYALIGWYATPSGGNEITAETVVNTNMTVYACWAERGLELTYELEDSYGDGWNGNSIKVVNAETADVITNLTIESGYHAEGTIPVVAGMQIRFEWVSGSYANEVSYTIDGVDDTEIVKGSGSGFAEPIIYTVPGGSAVPPPVVIDDTKMKEPVTVGGTRVIEAKDGTTLTQADVDAVRVTSPVDSSVDITGAYTKTLSPGGDQIVLVLAMPVIEPVAAADKDEDDATGLLEENVPAANIAAAPTPDTSDPDPANHEEVGAMPVRMYPGLYYQAGWGSDLNSLTYGTKFRADGSTTHIGVIKQKGPRGFYKLTVSER